MTIYNVHWRYISVLIHKLYPDHSVLSVLAHWLLLHTFTTLCLLLPCLALPSFPIRPCWKIKFLFTFQNFHSDDTFTEKSFMTGLSSVFLEHSVHTWTILLTILFPIIYVSTSLARMWAAFKKKKKATIFYLSLNLCTSLVTSHINIAEWIGWKYFGKNVTHYPKIL
jgi:hypothetical protein